MASVQLSLSSYLDDLEPLLELKNTPNLTELHITGSIVDEDVGLLCKEVLMKLVPLEKLTLELNECSDAGCVYIASLIEGSTSIKQLSLMLNNVGERGAQVLADGLSKSSLRSFAMYATQLDLHDCSIGDTGAGYIAAVVKHHRTLTSLCLAQNQLTNFGLSSIIECLPSSRVKELDLRTNLINADGAKLIGSFLSRNSTLKKLILDENHQIQNDGAKEIALSLTKNSSLEQLTLRSCGIGKKGAERFATCLAQNSILQALDLRGNTGIGDDAVELICRGLRKNKSLLELNLSSCGLGDEGCAHLADVLSVNTTLSHLWLQMNEIGDGGILSLSETLKQNTTLCVLSVSGNRFSQKGSAALIQSLSDNNTLTSLDIDSTTDSGSVESMIHMLLDKNRQLLQYKNWTKELLQVNKELVIQRDSLQKQLQKKK